MTLKIGLTGGIGSGKSTVADLFLARGAGIVDTDLIAHELTEPGTPTLERIHAAFGPEILETDGALNRAILRERVFANPGARTRLEAILHPRIRALMLERASALRAPYAILVIPLLFETGQETLADRILVVDCPESLQIERVRRRSGLSTDQIAQIMASQIPRAQRLAGADDIIDNQDGPEALEAQVDGLHRAYLSLASTRDDD